MMFGTYVFGRSLHLADNEYMQVLTAMVHGSSPLELVSHSSVIPLTDYLKGLPEPQVAAKRAKTTGEKTEAEGPDDHVPMGAEHAETNCGHARD